MLERTNTEWINNLQGANRDEALTDLRSILIRGLSYALSSRLNTDDKDALIEDFTQDSLIKILNNLHTFRGESKFTTWAQKIAIRVAFTELRRHRWKDISLNDILPENSLDFTPAILSDPGPSPEQRTAQLMVTELVQRVIREDLTERQSNAMLAVMAGNMPLAEVATRMGTNRNALYKLIHDARKKLQQRLLEEGLSPQDILSTFDL